MSHKRPFSIKFDLGSELRTSGDCGLGLRERERRDKADLLVRIFGNWRCDRIHL